MSADRRHDPQGSAERAWERAALLALREEWAQQSFQCFGSRLSPPTLSLSDAEGSLGSWRADTRELSIQRDLLRRARWLEVVEVLRHEMAHQFVSEVLKVSDEPPHGPTFQRVCAERGIDARAAGGVALSEEAERLLRRVRRLLALAESDNEHEAELAAAQAQELLTRHHLSLGGAPVPDDLAARAAALGARQLGEPRSRHFQYEQAVAALLCDHFFVQVIWVGAFCARTLKRGQVLEVCGRHEDLEVAEYVYHFLTAQLDRSWAARQRAARVSGLRERLSFFLGVVRGFHQKLDAQRAARLASDALTGGAEGSAEGGAAGTARALLALSDREAREHLARRHPHTRLRRGAGWSPSEGYHAGLTEGQGLTLHKGLREGPAGGARLGLEHKR